MRSKRKNTATSVHQLLQLIQDNNASNRNGEILPSTPILTHSAQQPDVDGSCLVAPTQQYIAELVQQAVRVTDHPVVATAAPAVVPGTPSLQYHPRLRVVKDTTPQCFPFAKWEIIHGQRSMDSLSNDAYIEYAYGSEGINCFFSLVYTSVVTREIFLEHALVCQDIVKEYYNSASHLDFSCWLVACDTIVTGPRSIRTRVNIIFPGIVISGTYGHQLCVSAEARLNAKCGYANVVQDAYNVNETSPTGLPGIFARQFEQCMNCMMKNTQTCDICHTHMHLSGQNNMETPCRIHSTVLEPLMKIHGDRTTTIFSTDTISPSRMFREISIVPRTNLPEYITSGFSRPTHEPFFVAPPPPRKKIKKTVESTMPLSSLSSSANNFYFKGEKLQMFSRDKMEEFHDPCIIRHLLHEVQNFHACYTNAKLNTVHLTCSEKSPMYLITVVNTRECHIVGEGEHHARNNVCFKVLYASRTIVQDCFNKCCHKALKANLKRMSKPLITTFDIHKLFPSKSMYCSVNTFTEANSYMKGVINLK